jgi:hypothetical protein
MRALARPEVLQKAALASFICAVACYPRLALWPNRIYPIWYLEAVLLLGGTVLWALVFAWHQAYTGRPVFTLRIEAIPFALATALGLVPALLLHLVVDPIFRSRTPKDYPANTEEWMAMTLFTLCFTQLFLVFAPFAWAIRLLQRKWAAVLFTIIFGAFVLLVKNQRSPAPLPGSLLLELMGVRLVIGGLSVYFYLRGGILLAWWWMVLIQGRLLFG